MKFKIMLLFSLASSIPIQAMENHDSLLDSVTHEFLAGMPQQSLADDLLSSDLDDMNVSDDPPVMLSQSLPSASSSHSVQSMLSALLPQASSSASQPASAGSEYFDQKDMDEALAAGASINPNAILGEVAADEAKTAKEALAAGLRRFKSQQQVLWSTKPITYDYTVDESVYEWVDCDWYDVRQVYKNGRYVYQVPVDIYQADGSVITKMINSEENPTLYSYDRYGWRQQAKTYRKKVCKNLNVVTKQAEIPLRFGIYQRDIADAALLAGNVAAEYCFNKYITSLRVNRIVSHILANIDDTEHFLQQIVSALTAAENEFLASIEGKGFLARNKLRSAYLLEIPKIKELFKTYTDRIAGTSSNPFNKNFFMNMENLPVIVGRLLLNRATDYLEKKYVMPDYQHVLKEDAIAYKQDENGELVKDTTIPPVSMVMLAKAIIHPKLFCQSIHRNFEAGGAGFVKAFTGGMELPNVDSMQMMSKLAGLPLPEWVFSDRMKSAVSLATEVCIEGLSMKFFNDYCAQQWVEFLGANHQELITLLGDYKKIKEQQPRNEEELKRAENAIRQFVQTGHDPSWFFPAKYWYMRFLTDYTTATKVKNYVIGGAISLAAWKAWSWWRSSSSVKQ